MSLPGDGARPSERVVAFHSLPTAALFLRGDRIVAVNAAYVRLMGTPAETIVGRAVPDLIGELVVEDDASLVRTAEAARKSGQVEGQLWIRVIDVTGRPRSVRVELAPVGRT